MPHSQSAQSAHRSAPSAGTRYLLFSRKLSRSFTSDAAPVLNAVSKLKQTIKAAGPSILNSQFSILNYPLSTLSTEYGALLTRSLLTAYVKGHDAARTRKYRKNSLSLDEVITFSWDLPNVAAVAAFSRQAFEMAGVQTNALRDALFEEAKAVFASGGTYLEWADSFQLHGFEPSNPFHLRTNYDTAANAAYSAAQWQQIQELAEIFPFLRYVTMQDDKVREEHAPLDGLVFPVDDPFWLTYMPPNGYNCRCSVEQLLASEYDPSSQPQLADVPLAIAPAFMNNPGVTNRLLYTDMLNLHSSTWKELGLKNWQEYTQSVLPRLLNTDRLDPQQLRDLAIAFLADRVIFDLNHVPMILPAQKAEKLFTQGKPLSDIRTRFKYLPCIDDTVKSPHEVWLNQETRRLHYLKRYDKNVIVMVEINPNNTLEYFNILVQNRDVDSQRKGILIYNQ